MSASRRPASHTELNHSDGVNIKIVCLVPYTRLPGLILFKGTGSQCQLKPPCKRLRIWTGLEGGGSKSQMIGRGSLDSEADSHTPEPKWPQVGASVSLHGGTSRSSPTLFLSPLALSRTKAADCNQAGNLYILALRNISRWLATLQVLSSHTWERLPVGQHRLGVLELPLKLDPSLGRWHLNQGRKGWGYRLPFEGLMTAVIKAHKTCTQNSALNFRGFTNA